MVKKLLLTFLFLMLSYSFDGFAQNGPNCPSGVCIGPGGSITSGSLTVSSNVFYTDITIKNGQTLTVQAGFTLYVGQIGTAAATQVVDFQTGCIVVIQSGASLVVNGLLNNSNNSNGVTFNGTVAVTGNVTAGNGSTIVGAGTLNTTGTITSTGDGSIFTATGECSPGPCSGSTLSCSGATNTISGNQTICGGNTHTTLNGSNVDSGAVYQWQKSSTTGANFTDISGANSFAYPSTSLTTTTYYRRKETFSGCTGTSSQVAVIVVATPGAPAGSSSQSFCSGATVASLVATGTAIKWYADSTVGSALATTTVLVNGTHYYASQTIVCESTTRFDVTATVNTASSILLNSGTQSPTVCQGNAITNTVYTFGGSATGVTVSGLPAGLTSAVSGSTITISGTPTASGTYTLSTTGHTSPCTAATVSGTVTMNTASTIVFTSGTQSPTVCAGTAITNTVYTFGGSATGIIVSSLPTGLTSLVSGSTITISGTPSASGTYTISTTGHTAPCTAATISGTVTRNAASTVVLNSGTQSPSVCAGNAITNTVYTFGGSATGVTVSGLPSGLTFAVSGSNITISGTPTASGTYTLSTTGHTSPCTAATISGTVTAYTLPTLPAATTTHPTCSLATGTIAVTVQNLGESYSFDNGATFQAVNFKPGLAAGIYNIVIKGAGGCNSPVSSVTVKSATNIWNGSAWSNVTLPSVSENIVFNAVYASTSDIVACSCQVNNSVSVIISSGHTLTLTNGLTVASLGSMTFQYNASLVQINNVVNSGNITYVRTTNTVVRSTDYTYWSSPVSPQTLGNFSPNTPQGMMYSYNSSIEDWKQEFLSTIMTPGVGYVVRGPQPLGIPPPPGLYTASFIGVPNNGTINLPIVNSGALDGTSVLLGNPYPSALNADAFLNANGTLLGGTIYFWTHNTAIQTANASNPTLGTGALAYTSNDYATYNITGGVGTDLGTSTSSAISGGTIPTGKIGAGQGFFATGKVAGTVTFNNTMRLAGTTLSDGTGVNQQFFKTKNPKIKTTNAIEKNRVWLNFTNTQGAFKQTLVGYITGATNVYDDRFDGESFDGNEFVDFYSVNQDKYLVIQGRALPFDANDEVPLGFRTTINGVFTINIDQADGLLTNQAVFLEDKLTNTVFDLKSGNYTFNTISGTFNDRFVLKYSNKTLRTNNFDLLEKTVLVSNKNKQIKIDSAVEMIDKVTIFDLLGRQIYQKTNVDSNELSISNLVRSRQIVIVKTVLQNGQEVGRKIIY